MKFVVDTHTHTTASGHAYSTILENSLAAKGNGLSLLCMTDHASSMPGAPHNWHFGNQSAIPRFLHGVGIVRGIEANILNEAGEIDVPELLFNYLDWINGSLHEPVFPPKDKATHTQTLINTIRRREIHAIAHSGNPNFDFDFEAVVYEAAKHKVAIEINNASLSTTRLGSQPRCEEIAALARDMGAYVTTGSDAHFAYAVGEFSATHALLQKVNMPEEQIITSSPERFLSFLEERGGERISEFSDWYSN